MIIVSEGRLSELFCAVLCTAAVQSYCTYSHEQFSTPPTPTHAPEIGAISLNSTPDSGASFRAERLSLQRLRTARQHGPVAVQQPIEQNLTILSDVVSASAIATTVCRRFQRYSVMPMTRYLTVL